MFRSLLVVIALVGAARESAARPVTLQVLPWTLELPDAEPWTVHTMPFGGGTVDYVSLAVPEGTVQVMIARVNSSCEDVMLGVGAALARDSDGGLRRVDGLPSTWVPAVLTSKSVLIACRAVGGGRALQLMLAAEGGAAADSEARLETIARAVEPHAVAAAPEITASIDPHDLERLGTIVAEARAARSPTTLPELGITITPYPWRSSGGGLVYDEAYHPATLRIGISGIATDVSCAEGFVAEQTWEEEVATPAWIPDGFHPRALFTDHSFDESTTLEVCADVPGGVMTLSLTTEGAYELSSAPVVAAVETLLREVRAARPLAPRPLSLAPVGTAITLPREASAWMAGRPDNDGSISLYRRWPKGLEAIELKVDHARCAGTQSFPFLPPSWTGISSRLEKAPGVRRGVDAYVHHEVCTTARDGRRITARVMSPSNATPARIAEVHAVLAAIGAHVGAEAPAVPGTLADPLTWMPKRDAVGFTVGYRGGGEAEGGVDLGVVLQYRSLEIGFGGVASGPEAKTLTAKAALNLVSLLDPKVSRVSLAFSAGATAFLFTAPGPDPNAEVLWLRGYVGAKLRVRCGWSLRAGYEPSFSETKPDLFGVGIEVVAESSRWLSVCSK